MARNWKAASRVMHDAKQRRRRAAIDGALGDADALLAAAYRHGVEAIVKLLGGRDPVGATDRLIQLTVHVERARHRLRELFDGEGPK